MPIDQFSSELTQFGDLAPHYDELMDIVPYDFWAEYVMTLYHFVGHQPQRVLDCACGTGNLSFELARLGLDVTGVDLSSAMIHQAKVKSKSIFFDLKTNFYAADLASFSLDKQFDSATCLYDSLNYILDPQHLQRAFAQIAKHIQPGGIWVFDFNSVYAFEANLFTQSSRHPRKKLHYDWQANFNPETRICTVHMKFQRTSPEGRNEVFQEMHRERAYSLSEIQEYLERTEWNLLHIFDAYTLNHPHQKSERWFFVASRR